jgi:nucleoside 2-deoxyribosyltransferase
MVKGEICLSGPFSTMAQIWLLEDAYVKLQALGARVFSPFHEFDTDHTSPSRTPAVLERLENCVAVLAIADGGALESNFHVGYARARRLPVILLAESVPSDDLTMFSGTDCEVVTDFTTALYRSYLAVSDEGS